MRLVVRALWQIPLCAWLAGCSDGTSPPRSDAPASTPIVAKAAPTVVRFVVAPDTAQLQLGAEISLAAYKVLSDSSRLPVSASWVSGNEGIVAVNGATGNIVAVGAGQTAVVARSGDFVAVAVVIVMPSKNLSSASALIVDQFSFIEFEYPSAPGRYFYAPQMRARAPSGHRVSVLTMQFSIPGLGSIPMFGCGGNLTDVGRDLFGEVYGDWLLEIGGGGPATGSSGSVTVSFVDDSGATGSTVIKGPIVQGSLPSSYSGGSNGGACFHGYGSTG